MSIRYTLRHNVPSSKLEEEDVNDSSTWDLDLLRKHELAETDDNRIVYRQHDGRVVDWTEATTQQAQLILDEIRRISNIANATTQEIDDNSENIATTAFVHNVIDAEKVTQDITDDSTNLATTEFVHNVVTNAIQEFAAMLTPEEEPQEEEPQQEP